jgi:hypothetical protein
LYIHQIGSFASLPYIGTVRTTAINIADKKVLTARVSKKEKCHPELLPDGQEIYGNLIEAKVRSPLKIRGDD